MKFIQVELFVFVLLVLISRAQSLKMNQPEFLTPLRNHTVEVGKNVTFECYVTGIEKYKVGWIKADTKAIQAIAMHVITNNPRVSVSHDELRAKFRLHIAGATLEDAGPYMCQINSMPVVKQAGYLTVIQPSDITKISGDLSVNEGGVARLTCQASGYPPPTIYWTREQRNEKITIWTPGRRIQVDRVENKTLALHKVTRSQMGSYLCIATNGYPPAVSKKVQLKVNFRPVITAAESRITVRPSEDVSLECIFEFHPRGLIWWEKSTGEIISRNDKYTVADYILNDFTVRSRLVIKNFQTKDIGIYVCAGRNMYNNKGDREDAQIAVGFLRLPETTTTQKMVPKHHQYEYTIPDIKTIEATTHYYDNFRQVDSNLKRHKEKKKKVNNYYSQVIGSGLKLSVEQTLFLLTTVLVML